MCVRTVRVQVRSKRKAQAAVDAKKQLKLETLQKIEEAKTAPEPRHPPRIVSHRLQKTPGSHRSRRIKPGSEYRSFRMDAKG